MNRIEKLLLIKNIKQEIKQAIENKEVDMADTTFPEYPAKIDAIDTSGGDDTPPGDLD